MNIFPQAYDILGGPISGHARLSRWTHDAINSKMVFGSGRAGDSSVYSLVQGWAEI